MALKPSPRLMSLVGAVLTLVFRLWSLTLRTEHHGHQAMETARQGRPCVFVIWHDELFAMALHTRRYPLVTIVSQSSDGEILAQALERLGMVCARGSSSRGGLKALVKAVREMRQGRHAVITVDGPRGPRHQAKDGAVYLAHKAGALIVPVRAYMSRTHVFHKAWDRFQLPLPFSRIRYVWGEPWSIEAEKLDDAVLEAQKRRIKESLDALG